MCIAIFNPKDGNTLGQDTLTACYENNPDGMGIMWTEDGVLKCYKTVDDFDTFCNVYNYAREKSTAVLHFRRATHGKIAKKNCHPFFVNKDLAFVHNGVLGKHGGDRKKSDTRSFMVDILRELPEDWLDNGAMRSLVYDYVRGNKMIFLSGTGRVWIFHKSAGIEKGGNWFSNSTYYKYVPKSKYLKNKEKHKVVTYKDGQKYEDAYYPWVERKATIRSENGWLVGDSKRPYCERCVPIHKVDNAIPCTMKSCGYMGYTKCCECKDSIFVPRGGTYV